MVIDMTDKPKRKHDETKPRWKVGLWALLFGLFLFVVHSLIFDIWTRTDIYYLGINKLISPYRTVLTYVSIVSVPTLAIVFLGLGINQPRFNSYFFASTILICLCFWFFASSMFKDSVKIIEVTEIKGQTYLLAVINEYDDLGYSPAGLYECDENNDICYRVVRKGSAGVYDWVIDEESSLITVYNQPYGQSDPYVVFEYRVE